MVVATAAIGALSGTVGTINTIKTWVQSVERFVRDFKEFGELLAGLQNNIQEYESRLDDWREFWLLDGASIPFVRELWGSKGTETIVSQLTMIESICNRFHEALDSFFGDSHLARHIHDSGGKNTLGSTSSRLAVFQAYTHAIKLTSSNKRIFSFVKTLNLRALEWLSLLEIQLAKLEDGAKRAFNTRHQQDTKTFLTQEQKETINAGVLMQTTMEYRDSSQNLFERCFAIEEEGNMPEVGRGSITSALEFVKLKIDLLSTSDKLELQKSSSVPDILERYHLLLKHTSQGAEHPEAELCILRTIATIEHSEASHSVRHAYQTALRERVVAHALCQGMTFCFRPPLEEERLIQDGWLATPVKELLTYTDSNTFLLQDRIHLAYKIVECGSLLTGTSVRGTPFFYSWPTP
jgi:hypothetical protein